MNKNIYGHTYSLSIFLYWGSDKVDVLDAGYNAKTSVELNADSVVQLDMISTLAVPFPYGSFIYSDSKDNSKLVNLIDMPLIHGVISFFMIDGTDMPVDSNKKPFGEEYFVEDIFITGIESIDSDGSDRILVKFSFASEDILKFTANITNVSTFDKNNSDKERDYVNDVIKNLFGAVKLSEKLDMNSFTANSNIKVNYINSSNENLLTALDYIYRKTYDDNFEISKDCSYTRVIYNHATHKYQQWKYDDVGTNKLLSGTENLDESTIRDEVYIDIGRDMYPTTGGGKFYFRNSGNSMDSLENFESVNFINYDYKKNEFRTKRYGMLDKMIVSHKNEFISDLETRAKIINNHGDKFKDIDYMREFTNSEQNGSIYDIITDSIFDANFYRVEARGSIGRKAGDEVYIKFNNSDNSPYETMKGDYLITAVDNRYEASGDNGMPSFKSIMDVHRPFIAGDNYKSELTV